MDQIKFSCRISNSNPDCPLGAEIWLDDAKIFDQSHVQNDVDFDYSFDDVESDHELRFVLKNKPTDYTQLDENNQITRDAVLRITDIAFDEIKLGNMISQQARYCHDYNGNSSVQEHKFYDDMGCNGTVSFKFSTPMYLWLLEHM